MMSEMGVRTVKGNGGGGDLESELGMLLSDSRRKEAIDRERELNIYRSGSAPPTVEGSLNAMGGLYGQDMSGGGVPDLSEANYLNRFSTEEELRSSPQYLSYYYNNVNLNPRLPPPLLSKEDWRSTQRLQAGSSGYGGIGDNRKMSLREDSERPSLFSQHPGFSLQEEHALESKNLAHSGEWIDEGNRLIGLSLGRQKSFTDGLQVDIGRNTAVPSYPSRSSSRNTCADDLLSFPYADNQITLDNEVANELHKAAGSSSNTFASAVDSSLRRSTTPDPQLVSRTRSPGLPPVGVRLNATERKVGSSSSFNGISSVGVEPENLISSLSDLSLSNDGMAADDHFTQSKLQKGYHDQHNFLFDSQSAQNNTKTNSRYPEEEFFNMPSNPRVRSSYPGSANVSGRAFNARGSKTMLNEPFEAQRSIASPANSFLKTCSKPSIVVSPGGSPVHHQNFDGTFTSYGMNAYAINPALSLLATNFGTGNFPLSDNVASTSPVPSLGIDHRSLGNNVFAPPNLVGATDLQNFIALGSQLAVPAFQRGTPNDPLYLQYLKATEYATKFGTNRNDLSFEKGYTGNARADILDVHKAYLGTLIQAQKQHNMPVLAESGACSHGYYGNPSFGLGMSYPGSPLASPIDPSAGPGSPLRLGGERNFRNISGLRNRNGGVLDSWNSDPSSKTDEYFPSSLLEEFKTSKTRCFELAEIAGHVVEFSADQYGSRFIQQKLETATPEEKNMVFEEITLHALSLMTDVFGNYVVQKFFEHGSVAQRRELANKLIGHVLALSLQMYGCRVIQKAIEVVALDQKIKMVSELDGHVMRCVRDQNGNHVIQKCIECVPQEEIHFIISTCYDHVVTLSTHPYGCRVIQRVLEHCDDPKTQQIVMDEILRSVCTLAQDQYGNYVVQHVLEHGKPHERSEIIRKLAGQIVQMSQQKFASNVVEKCLTFGGLDERQILVSEMLGSTDENEPLQAMMKDQFANYVVQKVLETCDDQQRELILSRIKVHLTALKKYTYGKHIVARVEKLVAAGERRIGLQSA